MRLSYLEAKNMHRGPTVNVASARQFAFLLHTEDDKRFPSGCAKLLEGEEALRIHADHIAPFSQGAVGVSASNVGLGDVESCLRDSGFGLKLEKCVCYALDCGYYTLLRFERGGRRGAAYPREIAELLTSTAHFVGFVGKQNSVAAFAQGINGGVGDPSNLRFERGRISAFL